MLGEVLLYFFKHAQNNLCSTLMPKLFFIRMRAIWLKQIGDQKFLISNELYYILSEIGARKPSLAT